MNMADQTLTLQQWSPTADYLESIMPAHQFSIIPLQIDQIEAAIRDRQVDFLLANPAVLHMTRRARSLRTSHTSWS